LLPVSPQAAAVSSHQVTEEAVGVTVEAKMEDLLLLVLRWVTSPQWSRHYGKMLFSRAQLLLLQTPMTPDDSDGNMLLTELKSRHASILRLRLTTTTKNYLFRESKTAVLGAGSRESNKNIGVHME
jgi:hypothetical protein